MLFNRFLVVSDLYKWFLEAKHESAQFTNQNRLLKNGHLKNKMPRNVRQEKQTECKNKMMSI